MRPANQQTILLLEDHKDTREMLKILLEDLDYRILASDNAVQALALAATEEIDLIITDYNLPDLNGVEFIRQVRGLNRALQLIPIIMVTAYEIDDLFASAVDAGCTAFFKKPTRFQELASFVSKLLKESKERNSVNNTSS
jgi:CheY-like chemotaxis protein